MERKGTIVDRRMWDEADTKEKGLIYLSLGADARSYHQKNPHIQIEKFTTHKLVHEFNITFTIPPKTTLDRFTHTFQVYATPSSHLFKSPITGKETFCSRVREVGALCNFKDLEDDLIKELFISNMANTSI